MNSNDILSKINRNDGTTVPEGYFDDFVRRMEASLPEMEWEREPKVLPRSLWQKVRPYVYMAAMFLGIWLMMNMVDLLRPGAGGLSLEDNPLITAAISNDSYIDNYFIMEADVNDTSLMDDLYSAGYDPSQLEETITFDQYE